MLQQIALFPLSILVLPSGAMKLRIFEQRYVRMVTEACSGKRPFAMMLIDASSTKLDNFPVGTMVEVIDFETLNDGMLGITVRGSNKVRVVNQWVEDDGLRVAEVEMLSLWDEWPAQEKDSAVISRSLQSLFREFPDIATLYPEPNWNDLSWVCQRWLELLPIKGEEKQELILQPNCLATVDYLKQIISDPVQSKLRSS